MSDLERFLEARQILLDNRDDYERAYEQFRWPTLTTFNWARDYFDTIAEDNSAVALHIVEETGEETTKTYSELSRRSNQVANFLVANGVRKGDRVLLMLGNEVALWESMLAAMKLGAVIVPTTVLLGPEDLRDRLERGNVRAAIVNETALASFSKVDGSLTEDLVRIKVGPPTDGWLAYGESEGQPVEFEPPEPTSASDPLFEYFTSGTTARPKLVQHTQASYPVGHLSTMYWLGLQPGDKHWNISSPGWAKHAWSSFFAPFNAEASVFTYNYTRFKASTVLQTLVDFDVTTLCAPPTVWRFLIQEDLGAYRTKLRELASAGEPLNPEVIAQVEAKWGLQIRDGYGQTETTAMVGNPPGAELVPGAMGRPLPGYRIALLDPDGNEADEGEICVVLGDHRPLGLMAGYVEGGTPSVAGDGHYRTGDVGQRDDRGYITYVGRADDVFKASGYRISPFELESVLIAHPDVAEAAVVPSPDPVRGYVPKAYITLADGEGGPETARSIFEFLRSRVSGYKMIRRIEFTDDLPKTISGKIRRVQLRRAESTKEGEGETREYREEDFR